MRCREKGIEIGERTAADATDISSLKHEKEAEYGHYYEHYGYKLDTVHDLNCETIPLNYKVMGINEYERTISKTLCEASMGNMELRRYYSEERYVPHDGQMGPTAIDFFLPKDVSICHI